MLILILVFGVFPNLLFRIFDPPVTDLVRRSPHVRRCVARDR